MNDEINDKKFIKISEVTKAIGASRKALQEYDKMGLVHPTAKTEGGYWLYDMAAVEKIKTIQMFSMIGYTRSEIKEFFASSSDSESHEKKKEMCATAVKRLKEKREQLDGLIVVAEYMSEFYSLPKEVIDKWKSERKGDVTDVCVDGSLIKTLKASADYLAKLPEEHRELAGQTSAGFSKYGAKLNDLACLCDEDYDSEKVQSKVEEAFVEWNNVLTELLRNMGEMSQDKSLDDVMSMAEQLGTFRNFFETSFKGVGAPLGLPSVEEQFVGLYGEETGDNISRMVDIFIEKRKE